MFLRFFLLFTIIPIAEIYVFIQAGSLIGLFNTIILVILTGIVGAWLARVQGFEIVQKIQLSLAQGQIPARELMEGLMILVGGITLLTPGFITDAFGLLMLIPPTRIAAATFFSKYIQKLIQSGKVHVHTSGGPHDHGKRKEPDAIDAEFTEKK